MIPRVRGRHCPVRALETWLNAANIEDGALFRRVSCYDEVMPQRLSAQSVALIIKRCAAEAGLDSSLYSGHSLRAGFVTNAAKNVALRQPAFVGKQDINPMLCCCVTFVCHNGFRASVTENLVTVSGLLY